VDNGDDYSNITLTYTPDTNPIKDAAGNAAAALAGEDVTNSTLAAPDVSPSQVRQYEVPPQLKAVGLLPVVELPDLTQEARMKEYYIGLEVHKDLVLMAVLGDRKRRSGDRADGDVIGRWEVATDSPEPVKAIRR
jgi:hypothetical protein